jgi:sugar phosphate isomerase/epimerase
MSFPICVDFDGTIVNHEYPKVGRPLPKALDWIKSWQRRGAEIILWTMRSGKELDEAVAYLKDNGIELFGINENPRQKTWTQSPKAYAPIYVDDAAFGCPLKPFYPESRPGVDWSVVGPAIYHMLGEDD